MQFSHLSTYLEKLEKTSSRNEITKILGEALTEAQENEIDKVCYLMLGELLPPYTGVEFNIAEKIMVEALAAAYNSSKEEVTRAYKISGDLGDVAEKLAAKKRSGRQKFAVKEVYQKMLEVTEESGEGSQERKINKVADLLSSLDPLSVRFVTRIPLGKMRLGFSDVTILDALSVMEKGDKSARPLIEAAFNVTADIGEIATRVKSGGLASLKKITAKPGVPIRPSLAERLPKIEEIFEKAGREVGVEQKLDGFRTQIHVWKENGRKVVRLFSRNLENTTAMFPEITEAAEKLHVQSVILDGETIGFDSQTGKFAPFQETVQRKRKHDIAEFAKKIPLKTFVFDVLYHEEKSLLEKSFRERRKILEKILSRHEQRATIYLTPQKITDSMGLIREELEKSLAAGLEGLVVKKLDSPYEAGGRGFHWIKLKATSAALEGLRSGTKGSKMLDTIDCVVMGAYKGRGKRAEFGVGGLLLGVRENDRYYSISRLGTGLSDEQFRESKKLADKLKVAEKPKEYVLGKEVFPDIWMRPKLVAEILADEITLSPRHTAGRGTRGEKGKRGYSLRFPRLVRFRDDKSPEDATTTKEIAEMYKKQR